MSRASVTATNRKPRPSSLIERVFGALADGQAHSGSELAGRFDVSRSAVWKAVHALRALQVEIQSEPRRGYHWPRATPPLSRAALIAALPAKLRAGLRHGEVRWQAESTNNELLRATPLGAGQWDFLMVEHQSAGRGRRERLWLASPGGSLCLSLGWCFAGLPADMPAISLAMGVCVVQALQSVSRGPSGAATLPLSLKWPNDVLAGGDKLGGILVELNAEAGGTARVVVGVGLNVQLPVAMQRRVQASGTTPADLAGLEFPLNRNALAAALLVALHAGLARFGREGFAPFMAQWRALDALAGKSVTVSDGRVKRNGHARGIDASGALCVQTASGIERLIAGDVSVRADS